MNYILSLKSEKTIIMITHKLHLNQYCDKVAILKKGGPCEIDTHENLLKNNQNYLELWNM